MEEHIKLLLFFTLLTVLASSLHSYSYGLWGFALPLFYYVALVCAAATAVLVLYTIFLALRR
jgi:hypothetical protein